MFEKRHCARPGYMSAFVEVCTVALQKQPKVESFIVKDDVVYCDNVDNSMAVSTPKYLIVSVLRG